MTSMLVYLHSYIPFSLHSFYSFRIRTLNIGYFLSFTFCALYMLHFMQIYVTFYANICYIICKYMLHYMQVYVTLYANVCKYNYVFYSLQKKQGV